ncbi:MAG: regulatory iron-sulfur-containing complex subunit RicT [Anaerolineaceae bacterium]
MAEASIIGVQFTTVGKIYHFSVPEGVEVEMGTYVLVNTARGRQLGKIMNTTVDTPYNAEEIQPIERVATARDLTVKEANVAKEQEALEKVQNFLKNSHFEGVKAISTEYSFDSTRLTFFLNYEPDSGFDIKAFLREVSRLFRDVRLEIRQVGPRDIAKSLSGLGACGIEKRCCARFLTEFSSISIKMAKSQDISLTPSEITGMCGRLRCCLNYEHEMYVEARNNLPKRKKTVQTPLGEGKVVQVLPLSNSVVVDLPESGPRQFTLEELQTGVLAEKAPKIAPIMPLDETDSIDVEMLPLQTRRKPEPADRRNKPQQERSNQPRNPQQRNQQQRSQQTDNARNTPSEQPKGNRRRKRR